MGKRLGGDTARTADASRPKGYTIPYDNTVSDKAQGKEEEVGTFVVTGLSSQVTITCAQALL